MLFLYKAVDKEGKETGGTIEAVTLETAITSLQRRGLVIISIDEADTVKKGVLNMQFTFLQRIKPKEIVILSRQISTLFEAQVSALRIFRLISTETENQKLSKALAQIADDLQGGSSISGAMEKHPQIFSPFYISMVKAGEESGKLDQTFQFLADYLDRSYEITSKAKSALIYPSFIVFTFIAVMVLMLTMVIPKISVIIVESGQELPIYTRIVIGVSNFFVNYSIFLIIALIVGGFIFRRFIKTESGARAFDKFKLQVPYLGDLYRKLYLARIADNLNTMLSSGIAMIRALELTKDVVDNKIYLDAIEDAVEDVKGGSPVSEAFGRHPEFPNILIQMIKVGEETGNLGEILSTLAKFYQREVTTAVDTLVDLIEPIMIILLAAGVGFLLASVLIPIYNISSAF